MIVEAGEHAMHIDNSRRVPATDGLIECTCHQEHLVHVDSIACIPPTDVLIEVLAVFVAIRCVRISYGDLIGILI